MTRRVRAALAVLLWIMVALLGLRLRGLSRTIMFPGDAATLPAPEILGRAGLSVLDCRTADGLSLRGAFVRPARADAPVVLYFHGNAEAAVRNLDLAVDLGRLGWGVAIAEYRGYGGMPGGPSEQGLYADGEAALAALAAQGVADARIVLVGRSLGCGVAVELARRGHGRALVLVAPATSMVDMGRRMVGPLAPWFVSDRFDNAAKVRQIRLPTLVVHGTRDEVVPFSMGETLSGRFPRGRLLPLPGVGHNDVPDLAGLLAREIPTLIAT